MKTGSFVVVAGRLYVKRTWETNAVCFVSDLHDKHYIQESLLLTVADLSDQRSGKIQAAREGESRSNATIGVELNYE